MCVLGALWLYSSRQMVVDAISYYQFAPNADIQALTNKAGLTSSAKYTFYATKPAIESGETFNTNCQRKEANSPILGCYTGTRIHIFNVQDERLQNIKTVTAAHEMLHAAYDRMSDREKSELKPLLQAEYTKTADEDLKKRMDYYAKSEPGQEINELHSIIGTEFASVSPELETYYKKYFANRASIVTMHATVEKTFDELSLEADTISSQIETLATSINQSTVAYNSGVERLNQSIKDFNARARADGGFTTQAQFESARQSLIAESERLNNQKNAIESSITEYKQLVSKLNTINNQAAELNKSIDSTLSDVPAI